MPLSKLFHKRNSVKDKKASNSANANIASSTSAKCDQEVEATVNKDTSSTEQLSPTIDNGTSVLCDSKEKTERIETVKDSLDDSKCEGDRTADTTKLLPKAESILEVSSESKHEEIQIEKSTSIEHSMSNTEIVVEVPAGMNNEQADEVDSSSKQQPLSIAKTTTNVFEDVNNAESASIEKLPPATESIIDGHSELEKEKSVGVARTSSELPYPTTENIKDMSCDSKEEATTVESAAIEKILLKKETVPDMNKCTDGVMQDETRQLPEHVQEQKYEPVSNSKETGYSIGASIHPDNIGSSSDHCELGQSIENVGGVAKPSKNKTRSASFKEAGSKPVSAHSRMRRRKCESESAASDSPEDEGFDDRVLYFREKDLQEVIGKCVNRLIRESIAEAVKNVDVDDLCEEVIKTMSDRSQSESSNTSECSATVEQKLHTNSVKEYADLGMLDTFEDSLELEDEPSVGNEEGIKEMVHGVETPRTKIAKENDCAGEVVDGTDGNESGNAIAVSKDKEIDLDGYRADLEESASLHSLTTKETNESNGFKADIANEEQEHTDSDGCHAGKEEAGSHSAGKENISKEMAEADDNPSENTTLVDSKSPEGCLNAKEEGNSTSLNQDSGEISKKNIGMLRVESEDLISMSDECVSELVHASDQTQVQEELPPDLGTDLPQQNPPTEEGKKVNWKVGYLHVKLPPKSRGKGHLKAWKKRCVAIHPDEFANDPKDPWLMISVYAGESGHARKHSASFWKSVSCRRAVVYRSSSSTRRHAFTVAEDDKPVVHLAADSEALSQEWMAAARAVLWPPSPVVQLEKMLNGSQYEVSLIDNEFSYRAGLLGAYGHLTITPKKLILVHPQQGYVLQEWYLNTVDRFELMPQTRIEDVHKVLCMTTCSDSSTGKGEILIFCREAVALLQSLASTIHQILTHHSKQEGGKYQKELEEMAEWLVPSNSPNAQVAEEYYKVPPRQVRSLLDIPNFIFDKPLTPVASVACPSGIAMCAQPNLEDVPKTSRASQDSGISAGATSADDFLNCSTTSFVVGGGGFPPGKSSDSELSDSYTPPVSPKAKHGEEGKVEVKA